jgi:hypothetical protein
VHVGGGTVTPEDGDWTAEQLTLINTPEAALMVRVGDIDNLGFGWPQGFNPFSGASTPQHAFPWAIDPADPAGTDRIMVPSSYNGHPPGFTDGYTSSTSRPDNLPQPIRLQYSLGALNVTSAALQIFFDDFQAPFIGSKYQVTINGVRAPFMEEVINQLNQTGPIGKLVTFQIPSEYLDLVRAGVFELNIDDPTTGAADGHAIDFVKLLINPGSFAQVATVQGHITDTVGGTGVAGAEISINGAPAGTTAADGSYKITAVAGLSFVEAKKLGYVAATQSADLLANATVTLDFPLAREFRLAISTPNAQGLPLSWPGWAQNVQIEFTPTLSNPNWLILQAPSPTSVNGDNQVTLGLPLQEGFYRIKR